MEIKTGLFRVLHPQRETPFMLSVMPDATGALTGAKGFEIGEQRPARQKHLLLTPVVRNWIAELEEQERQGA